MARSDNWRINKSGVMAIEGAQVLKALQKVAGAAGLPKGFKVRFATKAHSSGIDFDAKEMVIGAGRLFNEAPIPADLFDVLVGLTLHETGHQGIGTDDVWTFLNARYGTMTQHEIDIFQKFVNIGEDIAIESRIRANPNLAEYDEALHNWAVAQMRDAQPSKLMEVWLEYALGHKSTTVMNLPEELVEPMQQLVALTGWLRKNMAHYTNRARAYLNYWGVVKDAILNPPQPKSQSDSQGQQEAQTQVGTDGEKSDASSDEPSVPAPEPPSSSGTENETPHEPEQSNEDVAGNSGEDSSASEPDDGSSQTGDGDEKEGAMERPLAPSAEDSIDDELADAIEDAIESELEDITKEVAEEFQQQNNNEYNLAYPVIRSRETKTPLIKPNLQLRKRLERIMTIRKRLQARTMRGEQYGRIDKRHLHRIGTDERIFSLRYKFPDGFPNTRILIDLSSSMSGREADEVLEAAGALQTLVNAEVWCYNRDEGKINLVRMDEGKLIHTFEPDGDTPSGLAIVGVSLGMRRGGLVIHLTDGQHNVGQTPWTANWILKKNGINLVNLIWGRSTRQYALDGISYQKLDGLADFPEALYRILIEQVKLSKIGGK